MPETLHELIEKCASAANSDRPEDLPALAQLHTDLQSLAGQVSDQKAIQTVERASDLVEKIVVGDCPDTQAALEQVAAQISALQQLVDSDFTFDVPMVPPLGGNHDELTITTSRTEKVIADSDAALAVEFVGEASGHLDAAEAGLLKIEDDPNDLPEVNAVFRAFHTIKGVAGFLELRQIGALAHVTESLLDLARKCKLKLHGTLLDVVLEARDMMKLLVGDVDSAAKAVAAPVQRPGLDVLIAKLEAAARGELPTDRPSSRETEFPAVSAPSSLTALIPTTAAADHSSAAAPATGTSAASAPAPGNIPPSTEATVKVATGRLDALINTVGELVIAQAMVAQDLGVIASDQRLSRNLSHLGKITRSLQDLSMSMRMVPIAGVFQKMARLARDVGRKAGKDVDFVQVGSETELDRNVVEAISDPLVHMIRNAVDHGLEYPEDREQNGKPRTGRLVLKACHQSGNVLVEISDDGRGLQQDKILKKAIAAGIVREGQELSEQEIFQLIFHPGLSTAEKITDISGRGVGMDVVKKNVEALRGRIEISSTVGKGSVFSVRLPLTLAVIDGLIVRVGRERYIIPITSIEQSIRPVAKQLSTVGGKGELCMVREKLLPLVRLHRLFSIAPRTEDPTQALVVIVQEGSHRCCLLVDELIGQQQVVIKSVGKEIGTLPGIAGCAILGDGNVSLILDVAGIIHSAL